MNRSFSNRILGGVCGGLAAATPFNAWAWRALFLALSIGTLGVGTLAYLMWWWLLPMNSPLEQTSGGGWRAFIALLLSILLIGGWFGQAQLNEAVGGEVYWSLALLIVGVVFLLRQLPAGNRGNIALGLVTVAVPLVFLLGATETLTGGIYDTVLRAWPALLIFAGLWVILRSRLRFGGFVALAVSLALAGGIAFVAFDQRTGVESTQSTINLEQEVSERITTLQINLTTLATNVRVFTAPPEQRQISIEFIGSANSQFDETYTEDDLNLATYTINEIQGSDFPSLEDIGRGVLTMQIPQEIAVAIAFRGLDGDANFDLASLDLERLNLDVVKGDALVTLPEYQPLSPTVAQNPGEWLVQQGDLDLVVPPEVGVRLTLDQARNRQPIIGESYDDLVYALELGATEFILISRRFENLPVQLRYEVAVPQGALRVVIAN